MDQQEKTLFYLVNLVLGEIGESISSFEELSDENILLKLINKM